MSVTPEGSQPAATRVLVADDDEVSRQMLGHQLATRSYEVVTAASADEAMALLQSQGTAAFDCLISDYYMPGQTGLDLLLWSKELDPTLAFIMVTGAGEKQLVADALRCGATDYLEKPLRGKELAMSVERAVTETREQRRLTKSDTEAKAIGSMQMLLGLNSKSLPSRLEVCHHACHGPSGDFFNAFVLPDGSLLVLAADVSGHDLKAAFVSAYFQGIVRGMIAKETPIPEILAYFNQLLIEEWGAATDHPMATSLAVCSVQIDFRARRLQVFNNGFPLPVQMTPTGEFKRLGFRAEQPLGLVADGLSSPVNQDVIPGAYLYLWTDGLSDFAHRSGISHWALAGKLLLVRTDAQASQALLGSAQSDIMLIRIELTPSSTEPASDDIFILNERYSGDQSGDLDDLQEFWRRSIRFVLQDIEDFFLSAILGCAREAVLNALTHGCRGEASKTATLTLAYSPNSKKLRMVVSDPGVGHSFDLEASVKLSPHPQAQAPQGLSKMKRLAEEMRLRRSGAEVELVFNLPELQNAV